MDMEFVRSVIELGRDAVIPLTGLAVALVAWKTTGKLDAKAAIGHAIKLAHVVQFHVASSNPKETEDTGVAEVLAKVEAVDGRRRFLIAGARKLGRRAKAHVEAAVRAEHRRLRG